MAIPGSTTPSPAAASPSGQPFSGGAVAAMLESVPDGIVIVDRHGLIVFVNERSEELFGARRDELLGQPVEILLPHDQRQIHTAHRLRYVAAPRPRPMGLGLDLWARRSDGVDFPVEISLSPTVVGGGEYVVAAVRDVSARRAADRELRRVHALLDAINEAVYVIDGKTLRFTYVNHGGMAQSGYSGADLATMTPLHLLPEQTEAELRHQLEPLLSGELTTRTLTTVLRNRSGHDLPIEISFDSPSLERDDERQIVAVMRDISERVTHQAELQEANQLAWLSADRERIARDLHDTVVQELFASSLSLAALAMRLPDDLRARIEEVVERQDDVIREIRTTIFGLSTRSHLVEGVQDQARAVVDQAAQVLGFRPSFRVRGLVNTQTTDPVAAQVLPTLREALSNVARHARATRVEVDLEARDGSLTLRVADDGVGLPATTAAAASAGAAGAAHAAAAGGAGEGQRHGLANLADRARQLGGRLTLDRADRGGTILEWTVPL